MRENLNEELRRVFEILYKEEKEPSFIDNLIKSITGGLKIDNPKKADLVSDDVQDFFKTLEDAAKDGGISEQRMGSMTYQKAVESLQIGLLLLDPVKYALPKYGVDGLFGPETANAVKQFKKDHLNIPITESVNVVPNSTKIIGKPYQGRHNAKDWESSNAWDIAAKEGSKVYSISTGVVRKVTQGTGSLLTQGVKKIYGDQISIKSQDGKPDVFYTHIETNLKPGDKVKEGDVIGVIMQYPGIPTHLHIGLSNDANLFDYANLNVVKGGVDHKVDISSKIDGEKKMTKASTRMLNKLIELLKEKNIKSEDLKKHLDPEVSVNADVNSDWSEITQKIIDNFEGGYWNHWQCKNHPYSSMFDASGETLFGLDRKAGGIEKVSSDGKKFFKIIDDEKKKIGMKEFCKTWKHGYRGGNLENELKQLASKVMKKLYDENMSNYVKNSELKKRIERNKGLLLHMAYATWNGPGYFQKFAKKLEQGVNEGLSDKELIDLATRQRTNTFKGGWAKATVKVNNMIKKESNLS